MSNSSKKQPRRSFATASPHSTPQHVGDGLRYDGEDVPVLIRLPDLSPQALLRERAAKPKKPESPAASMPTPTPTARRKNEPPALEHSKPVKAASSTTVASKPPTDKPLATEPEISQAIAEPPSGEPTLEDQTNTTNTKPTLATVEGSPRKRRRRNRGGRNEKTDQRDKVQSMSQEESRQLGQRRTASTPNVDRQNRNILPFDPSPLIIVTGLLVVAGLTYVVMTGGDEEPADSADNWSAGATERVVQSIEETPEPEANLWPPDEASPSTHDESALAYEAPPAFETTPAAPVPVWPTESARESANSYDSDTIPTTNYSYNATPIVPSKNIPNTITPRSHEPSLGWPMESMTPARPTSTTGPVGGWPEAAMATPNIEAPGGRYASQPARYTETSGRVSSFPEEPAARTGRLETGPYPGRSLEATASPGSQLNGTIEIPRPRANYEYNGSSVY